MSDAVDDLVKELNEATRRAWTLVQTTDARHFTVRPKPSSWSAAECLSHLSISSEQFLPALKSAIDDARKRNILSDRKPKMDVIGRVLRWFLEPPIRQRVKTTARFVPRSVRAKAEAFGEFAALQEKVAEQLAAARGLNLSKVKVISPFDKRVRYNLYSAFRVLVAHQRRHLWQAEQAVAELRHDRVAVR